MSYKPIIAGLRKRIMELRRKLDKVRGERDRARAENAMLNRKLNLTIGQAEWAQEIQLTYHGKAANGLERIAEAEHVGYSGIDSTLRRAGLKPPWEKP